MVLNSVIRKFFEFVRKSSIKQEIKGKYIDRAAMLIMIATLIFLTSFGFESSLFNFLKGVDNTRNLLVSFKVSLMLPLSSSTSHLGSLINDL